MINVLLVEDHELYRMGLSLLLSKADNINLLSEAADGTEGIKKARELSPDVILMDIGLPNIDGIEATQRIKDFNQNIKILIFTSRDSENDVFEAFKAGADGYIMKGATPEQTISAIQSVYEGIGWIDPNIAKMVFSNLQKPSAKIISEPESSKQGRNNSYGLTERELDVLELMVEGLTNPQIAEKLVVSRATAKAHVHSILQKLCASSRTQATVMALNEGLV
jgi:DNA-binding NarL/FixJ family response regulator